MEILISLRRNTAQFLGSRAFWLQCVCEAVYVLVTKVVRPRESLKKEESV